MATLKITEARGQLGGLARKAATTRERTYLSDHGQTSAVVVAVSELEDLEDAIAVLEYELRKARGEEIKTYGIDEVKAGLDL